MLGSHCAIVLSTFLTLSLSLIQPWDHPDADHVMNFAGYDLKEDGTATIEVSWESASGEYKDKMQWADVANVWEDCEKMYVEGDEKTNFLVDFGCSSNNPKLQKAIANAAGKAPESLFPGYEEPDIIPVEPEKCTLEHDEYNLTNYCPEESVHYFKDERKWHKLACRNCKELLREKPKPSYLNPFYICRNEHKEKIVCPHCVCFGCWMDKAASSKNARARRCK